MSNIRVHGSVTLDGQGGHMITFEVAGFDTKEAAMQVNSEIAEVIRAYFESVYSAKPVDQGHGTPPWKKPKQ